MIFTLWVSVLGLSLVLLILGKFIDAPPLQLAGSVFLFLLGLVLLLGGLQYEIGIEKSFDYVCGCCVNGTFTISNVTREGGFVDQCDNSSYVVSSETEIKVYRDYQGESFIGITLNHIFGLFLSLIGAFSFIIILLNLKSDFKNEQ